MLKALQTLGEPIEAPGCPGNPGAASRKSANGLLKVQMIADPTKGIFKGEKKVNKQLAKKAEFLLLKRLIDFVLSSYISFSS